MKPRYDHDCDTCVFLGPFEDHDLYVCSHANKIIDTVIGRYGSDGPDYVSNVDFAIMYRNGEIKGDMSRILHEALCRAEKIGVETTIKNVRIFRD